MPKSCQQLARTRCQVLPPAPDIASYYGIFEWDCAQRRLLLDEKYISHFPKPLLDDLIAGRWLPVVGAGMSRNAVVPAGKVVPLWEDLGKELAADMPEYPYSGALDAISAYSHEYGRAKLVERLAAALLIDQARPGEAHRAFCSIPFDIVCTTNLDFLLERQYDIGPRYCRPIIDEEQLSVANRDSGISLLKLHGDVHHPQRLVVTEGDYDGFLENYPLLSTYLASLLIGRTAVLVGYSLDDPDFRQIWHVVGERLGSTRRLAYAMLVDARATEVARFERRGVKVISLPGTRTQYGQILAEAFDELRDYLSVNLIPASQVTEEDPLKELSLPQEALTRLCFFAVPFVLSSFYKERVFPIAERHGFVPITADDVIAPGDNIMAKIDALLSRAQVVVVDATSTQTLSELRTAQSKDIGNRLLVISERGAEVPFDIRGYMYIERPPRPFSKADRFLSEVTNWFALIGEDLAPRLAEEPRRLLELRAYRAAVTSAMTLLETHLRVRLQANVELPGRAPSLGQLIRFASKTGVIPEYKLESINRWVNLRNQAVHGPAAVSRKQAQEIVSGVEELIREIRPLYAIKVQDRDPVTKDEAVRRLRAAGFTQEADELEAWRDANSSNSGWDGWIRGAHPHVVKTIWSEEDIQGA